MSVQKISCVIPAFACVLVLTALRLAVEASENNLPSPYQRQVTEQIVKLNSSNESARAVAAESLGFMRAYTAEAALLERLDDEARLVRRQVAMALGWCGGRLSVPVLFQSLQDDDSLTRQAAQISLTNLTGVELPYHASAALDVRQAEVTAWRSWWSTVAPGVTPREIMELLRGPKPWLERPRLIASSTYRGPPEVLLDGVLGPLYWQTKNVPFPQSLTIEMRRPEKVQQVVVHQYGPRFVMTDYELALSMDNEQYQVIVHAQERSPAKLVLDVPSVMARYVRITSFASANPTYPTTFLEVEVNGAHLMGADLTEAQSWRYERGLRGLGVLGGRDVSATICGFLGEHPPLEPIYRPMVTAGIRSLGRLKDERGFEYLVQLLHDPMWARRAADALGDFDDARAVPPLLDAYTRYAKRLDGSDPLDVPADDKMSFPSEDRMLETPYSILFALCRLNLDAPGTNESLRGIAPLLLANQPGDHDTFMLYEPEPGHTLTRYLLQRCGMGREALEHTFAILGQGEANAAAARAGRWPAFAPYRAASWLPTLCTEPGDLPRLLALLEHEDGWVRLNAAKALAWLGDRRAVEPLAQLLASTPPEAAFGLSGVFKDEEYMDLAPRWREGLIRALGLLEAHEHTQLLERILEDEQSVLEIRRAAADALADLGNEQALDALRRAAAGHGFFSIRHTARDALRMAQVEGAGDAALEKPERASSATPPQPSSRQRTSHRGDEVKAIVFLKGNNNIPNTIGTVEQADRWRQTYVVTDSGPAYRPARNLYLLSPPDPSGKLTSLTRFEDGYVAEPELSWDATHVVFCRRGEHDPWWHVWRVNMDGTELTQLTRGPYHFVGPTYLSDGRLVCASSRLGIRDEYHGYPCTGLVVMNADGTDVHPIATNIGRDNEPAILLDGRLVFSRLEVFYSRNKTELTLHAAHADGTQDVVLYGPERRRFWRELDHGPPTPADGQEAPLTHRVLRMTQPQPMPDGRGVVVVTQGGLARVSPLRDRETILTPDNKTRAYTTPFPLSDGRILCASTLKTPDREQVDLGIYMLDPAAKSLELVYNDPVAADFEARPVQARQRPDSTASVATSKAYTGRFFCSSVYDTQEPQVATRGRYVRLIEGVPMVARHSTQTNPWEVWKNHGGTLARVLGTVPLASDGSFFVEAPADRLLHFQVLDSDRRVVGNQLTWIYTRPGETKSCVGCHESPHAAAGGNSAIASHFEPSLLVPHEGEFRYRAKAWLKGHLPPEIEERTRTVRAVNLLGR